MPKIRISRAGECSAANTNPSCRNIVKGRPSTPLAGIESPTVLTLDFISVLLHDNLLAPSRGPLKNLVNGGPNDLPNS
jgi:hypothetical protein